MGWDFSAFDAELNALWAGPVADALPLAHKYAGSSSALADIDAQLNQLDADRALERLVPAPRPQSRPPAGRSLRSSAPPRNADLASDELVLPDPMEHHPAGARDASEELLLHGKAAGAPHNGSFWLEPHTAKAPGRDDTLEPFDDELSETDEVIEFTAARSQSERRPSSPAGQGSPGSLFHEKPAFGSEAQRNAEAQLEADAAFAELFVEAARPSSAPSARNSSAPSPRNSTAPGPRTSDIPERYADDTETFDASARAFVESAALRGEDMGAEELDSAEFELMIEADGDPRETNASSSEARTPQAGEKRPSFLGRLFGRKDE